MTSVYNILMSLTLIYLKNNYILTLNQQVPGSSPGWVTNEFKALQIFCKAFFVVCCQNCCQSKIFDILSFKILSII